jgi:NADH-quinone oxidoreductase subunit J
MINDFLLAFFTVAALAGAAAMLVLRHPMRVALALVATMLSLAGVYGLLGAHAVAVFQVLIYVGAVMVFMVYVIMLLDVRETSVAHRYSWMLVPGVLAFVALVAVLGGDLWQGLAPAAAPAKPFGVQPFAAAFLNSYWLHFELISVLLVAAVVAAIAVIQLGRKAGRRG